MFDGDHVHPECGGLAGHRAGMVHPHPGHHHHHQPGDVHTHPTEMFGNTPTRARTWGRTGHSPITTTAAGRAARRGWATATRRCSPPSVMGRMPPTDTSPPISATRLSRLATSPSPISISASRGWTAPWYGSTARKLFAPTCRPDRSPIRTLASQPTVVLGAAYTFYPTNIAVSNLPAGTNVVAVEVHLYVAGRTSLGFDMEVHRHGLLFARSLHRVRGHQHFSRLAGCRRNRLHALFLN